MRLIVGVILSFCLSSAVTVAQSAVSVKIAPTSTQNVISPDFIGLSFEAGSLRYNHYRKDAYFFDSSNTQLLNIFQSLGVRSLRIGGNSLEGFTPSAKDIDALFRFAKAAGVKVIYSLPLATGSPSEDASVAKYIWDNYRDYLICFAIGNEPNSYKGVGHGVSAGLSGDSTIRGYASYIAKWNRIASAVTAAVPMAKLGGPDSGNGATSWTAAFAQAETGNRNVTYIFSHYEPGGPARGKTLEQLIDEMLSPTIDSEKYLQAYDASAAISQSLGYSYRYTETNTHVASRDTVGVNHSFATALFALDHMHWWAAHQCAGVNFHTGLAGFNAALFPDPAAGYGLYPISYGVAAFNVGGHGKVDSLELDNPGNLNLTAYAVTDADDKLFVTVINKEHGAGARDAIVHINAIGKKEGVVYLETRDHDVSETSDTTLGGASIDGSASWQGKWSPVDSTGPAGSVVKVEASSAAIVEFSAATITSSVNRDR